MVRVERLICASDALADGGLGVRFEMPAEHGVMPAFVVRFEGQVYAFYNRCGHVPVELDWNDGRFFDWDKQVLVCTVHGAVYDPRTGRCVGGPGRAGLTPIPVIERDGQVFAMEEKRDDD